MSGFRRFSRRYAIGFIALMVLGHATRAKAGNRARETAKTKRRVTLSQSARPTAQSAAQAEARRNPRDSNESASTQHREGHLAETKPDQNLSLPNQSTDEFRKITSMLNGWYDSYDALKAKLNNDYNVQYSLLVSSISQWGMPHGGPGTTEIIYTPTITWNPFTNSRFGSGSLNFEVEGNQFWSKTNTDGQVAAMGILAPPNAWGANSVQFGQLSYTHTLPGSFVAATIGQYSFAQFDGNEYAGNSQANFLTYPLAQDATQTYANAGFGAYLQITPNTEFALAGGFQEATDVTADTIEVNLGTGKYAYFLNGQWSPSYLGGGTYSFIFYHQPSVPQQPSDSYGYSFSGVQNINSKWGLFSRINYASGEASAILTSLAGGVTLSDPFGRNELDRLGLGAARDWTNQNVTGTPADNGELVLESFYNFTISKGFQFAPDMQIYVNPGLDPANDIAAVFSLRVTLDF